MRSYKPQDNFYKLAQKNKFTARSIYKLEELDNIFNLIKPKSKILDLGCSPGSWIQYITNKLKTDTFKITGVDLRPMNKNFGNNVTFIKHNIFDISLKETFDTILCDIAPNTSGIKVVDQARSLELSLRVIEIVKQCLKKKGNFCVKVFASRELKEYIQICQQLFEVVRIKKPSATRPQSSEVYIIGLNFNQSQ